MESEDRATILIVEDNPADLDTIRSVLQKADCKTLVATSGERAIRQLERLHPDLILLNLHLPGIDGFETCRRIKQNNTTHKNKC